MKNRLQTIDAPTRYQWRGNTKQKLFMELYLNPTHKTFGNAYQSGITAGFSHTYSKNITHLAPKWLSEFMEKVDFRPEHIKQGIQQIAVGDINSKSVDDTRLKAYELLMRIEGMGLNTTSTTVNIVQPILGGASQSATNTIKHVDSIDVELPPPSTPPTPVE